MARNKYNAVSDSFFSTAEILDLMYQACIELTRENNLIEGLYSTSTIVGTQAYSYPTTAISIKRITYEGQKLKQYTMREDDSVTGLNQATTSQGTPVYYFMWNKVIYLRPIPSAIGTLNIYTYNEPQVILSTSTLEIPTHFHADLTTYILASMAAKDSNFSAADRYDKKWKEILLSAKKWARLNKRSDSFTNVQDEDILSGGFLGLV